MKKGSRNKIENTAAFEELTNPRTAKAVPIKDIQELANRLKAYVVHIEATVEKAKEQDLESLTFRGFNSLPVILERLHSCVSNMLAEVSFPSKLAEWKPSDSNSTAKPD